MRMVIVKKLVVVVLIIVMVQIVIIVIVIVAVIGDSNYCDNVNQSLMVRCPLSVYRS